MTKDEALKLALDVMRSQGDVGVDEWIATEAAIKEALAQPEQEPCQYCGETVGHNPKCMWAQPEPEYVLPGGGYVPPVPLAQPEPPPECKTEEEKTAFAFGWWKALETQRMTQPDYRAVKTYHEGKPVYVSQPEQEPVAVYGYCPECGAKGLQRERRPDGFDRCVNGHIYPSSKATPPQRPWVGLTDEQREECTQSPFTEDNYDEIEAKLKELNT